MLKCEFYTTRKDGVMLVKTYSDSNKYILQNETNIKYDVAIDVGVKVDNNYVPLNYTYTETDEEVEADEQDK